MASSSYYDLNSIFCEEAVRHIPGFRSHPVVNVAAASARKTSVLPEHSACAQQSPPPPTGSTRANAPTLEQTVPVTFKYAIPDELAQILDAKTTNGNSEVSTPTYSSSKPVATAREAAAKPGANRECIVPLILAAALALDIAVCIKRPYSACV